MTLPENVIVQNNDIVFNPSLYYFHTEYLFGAFIVLGGGRVFIFQGTLPSLIVGGEGQLPIVRFSTNFYYQDE